MCTVNSLSVRQAAPKPCILVVEDDASLRRSIQLLLHGRGFDVRAYAAADPMLRGDDIAGASCLVTDYCLGGHDGIGVLEALRERGWNGPAILVTAYPTRQIRQTAEAAGFSAFLEKPFRDHALVNTVAKLTKAAAAPAEGSH